MSYSSQKESVFVRVNTEEHPKKGKAMKFAALSLAAVALLGLGAIFFKGEDPLR
jgi:hypothetical protein